MTPSPPPSIELQLPVSWEKVTAPIALSLRVVNACLICPAAATALTHLSQRVGLLEITTGRLPTDTDANYWAANKANPRNQVFPFGGGSVTISISSLSSPPHSIPPPSPFSPSLISLVVSVDVKHHVYLQLYFSSAAGKARSNIEDHAVCTHVIRRNSISRSITARCTKAGLSVLKRLQHVWPGWSGRE